MSKEIPVTYNGIMVGVAEVDETKTPGEEDIILNVRLTQDSLLPIFVDHTMDSISIKDDTVIPLDQPYYPQDDEYDPERLCNSCDLKFGHAGPCTPYFTPSL